MVGPRVSFPIAQSALELIDDEDRKQRDAKLKELQANGVRKLGEVPFAPDDVPVLPGWPEDNPNYVPKQTFGVPDDDPEATIRPLGRSVLTQADIEGDQIPAGYDTGIGGAGGPQRDVADAEVIDLESRRRAEKQARIRGLLLEGSNPDESAEDQRLAKNADVLPAQVTPDREAYQASERAKQVDDLERTAPRFHSWISDPDNFRVAHDDLENLSWWDRAGKIAGAGAQSAFPALKEGLSATGQMLADQIDLFFRSPDPLVFRDRFTAEEVEYLRTHSNLPVKPKKEGDILPQTSAKLGEFAASARKEKESFTPSGMNDFEAGAYSGVQSFISNSPGLIISALTKTPLPALASGVSITTGQAYTDARAKGLDVNDAARFAVTQGAIEYATEKLPMSHLFGDIAAKTPFMKMLTRQLVEEGVGEQAATLLQDANEWATLNPDKTVADFLAERPSAALQTAIATVIQVGAQTTISTGTDQLARQLEQNAQQKRAEDVAGTIKAMADGAKDSKLLKRLPDKYREAVAAVTKDGPLESVRIQPEAITELAQANNLTTAQLAQAFRIDPADMEAAIQSGDDVVIPSGNYAAAIQTAKKEIGVSGETIHAALAPNMRLRADDFTAKEAAAMKQVYEAEQKAREESATTEQSFADSADRVREAVRQEVAKAGIFNTETANIQATVAAEIAVTLAERTGQDPEKVWNELGFKVQTDVGADGELAQSYDRVRADQRDKIIELRSRGVRPADIAAQLQINRKTVYSVGQVYREKIAEQYAAYREANPEPPPAPKVKEPSLGLPSYKGGYDARDLLLMYNDGMKDAEIAAELSFDKDADVNSDSIAVRLTALRNFLKAAKDQPERLAAITAELNVDPAEIETFVAGKIRENNSKALSDETLRAIDLKARGASNKEIAHRVYPDVDPEVASGRIKVLVFKHKAKVEARRAELQRQLAQVSLARAREPNPPTDEELSAAAKALFPLEFEAWKAAREGLSNPQIVDRINSARSDATMTSETVSVHLAEARAKGFEAARSPTRILGERTLRTVELRNQGLSYRQIAERLYPELDVDTASKRARVAYSKYKDVVGLLDQGERGFYSGHNLAADPVITLTSGANLSTFLHESSHWYLTTLEKMARAESPHPEVIAQLAAIREWAGKNAEFEMYDANGLITPEGRDVQEKFAETFEAYLREGKAPTTALRSVFAAVKAWLMRIYQSVSQIGRRVQINDEIRQVFDRMLATDEAIKAAQSGMARDSEAMAKELLAKGVITEKAFERTKERIAAARERAEAELMARLMEDYERTQKAWWRDEERQVRREVQSEIDERPEQRAYTWLAGQGWRDTRADHANRAANEAELSQAFEQEVADFLKYLVIDATEENLVDLKRRMLEDKAGFVIGLFRTANGKIIAFNRDEQRGGWSHDQARELMGLGDLKLEHGQMRVTQKLSGLNGNDWYAVSGTQDTLPPKSKPGELAQFMPAGAQGGPINKMRHAMLMDIQGDSKEDIWRETGWAITKNGEWVWELPGEPQFKFNPESTAQVGRLDEMIDWPELFEAMPALRDVYLKASTGGQSGGFYPFQLLKMNDGTTKIASVIVARGAVAGRSTLMETIRHEIQHAIQTFGGFASTGASTEVSQYLGTQRFEEAKAYIRDLEAKLAKATGADEVTESLDDYQVWQTAALKVYSENHGEWQARQVEMRSRMSPEWRWANPPGTTVPGTHENVDERQTWATIDELRAARSVQPRGNGGSTPAFRIAEALAESAGTQGPGEGTDVSKAAGSSTGPDRQLGQETNRALGFQQQVREALALLQDSPELASGALSDIMDIANVSARAADLARRTYRKAQPQGLAQLSGGGIRTLQGFFQSNARNAHVQVDNYEVYLRKARHIDETGKVANTIDLASITRSDAENASFTKGRAPDEKPGDFKELVQRLETEAAANGYDAVYVENVLNEFLPEVLQRYGYTEIPAEVGPSSFIKHVEAQQLAQESPSKAQYDKAQKRRDDAARRGDLETFVENLRIMWPNFTRAGAIRMGVGEIINARQANKLIEALPEIQRSPLEKLLEDGWWTGLAEKLTDAYLQREGLAQSGALPPQAKPPENLPKMRLDLNAVGEQYGEAAVQSLPPEVAAFSASDADQDQFLYVGPDEAATIMGFADGDALLQALKQGPERNRLIRELTQQRMLAAHGDPFKDGTIMREAEVYARNEVQQRQFEIEMEALAKAAGKQFAGNLAKSQAQENLRAKQVREVLNYDQWRRLADRWGQKALEAAGKGDMDKASEYARFRLINTHMFLEGRKLAEKIEKTRKALIDYGSKTKVERLNSAGPEYAQQMEGLLDDYQLRNESKRQENNRAARAVWIQQQLAGLDPFAAYQDTTKSAAEQQVAAAEALERSKVLSDLSEGVDARNYKSITVEELLGVKAEADLIWKLATTKDRLLKEGERRSIALAAGDIVTEVETSQPNKKPPEAIESGAPGEGVKRGVLKYFAMHRTLQSLAHQFAGGKDGGKFWDHIVRPLNEAYARLSTLRKQMGKDLDQLFSVYSSAEKKRFFKERQHFASLGVSLTKQGRLAIALNWGNEKNRKRLMDSTGWDEAGIAEVLNTLDKRDWDFIQATWDYLDTWFPDANKVHEAVHGAPMDKEQPLPIATRFGIYRGGYYPIRFDAHRSSKAGQRQIEAEVKAQSGRVDARSQPGFSKSRVKGKVTLPINLDVIDVVTSHLDQVATSIATEETLFDVGRLIKRPEVETAIVERHGRQIYNTIVNTLVTTKFGLEGASGILAHLRNGATVVGLGWKVATALLQPVGVTNSIVRVGGYWIAKGYARMGTDAATLKSSADWIMQRSEFMRNRRQSQSPEQAALKRDLKKSVLPTTPRIITDTMFSLMSNVQFYSVDMPTWYGAFHKAQAAGMDEAQSIAQADQAVIDAQGGGDLHQTAAIQTGAGTKYAAALRLLTNFMSYMITTYNLTTQRARNADTAQKVAALSLDMILLLAVPVAAKMALDAWTKGGGDDDDDPLWEKYGREQAAFLMSPFVGLSQVAGAAKGDDAFSYRGPAGLGIFGEVTNAGKAAAELDFDESFWRPANKAAGMMLHYPASQLDASFRGAQALYNGETTNPGVIFFGPPPAN